MKIKLHYKSISEVVGVDDVGLITLLDEYEQRQLNIVCDKFVVDQIQLRDMGQDLDSHMLLPEALLALLHPTEEGKTFEIFISSVRKGEYVAELRMENDGHAVKLRAPDAVLLSIITHQPILIDERLMNFQSVPYQQHSKSMALPINTLSSKMIRKSLEKAIEEENYELASQLRDELNSRKDERS